MLMNDASENNLTFRDRHIGITDEEQSLMLDQIAFSNLEILSSCSLIPSTKRPTTFP